MISFLEKKRGTLAHKILSGFICFTFVFSLIVPPTPVQAQTLPLNTINLPAPGTMLLTSNGYVPTYIKGIQLFPDDPLKFNFIIDSGDSALVGQELEDESITLIKYFLASLTVPEKEMWVNLSPYEQGRIIPDSLGGTDMGRDLLAQDYILKQLTASLMYPEDEVGKKFWKRVYKRAFELYGTTEIPVNTFNKVWIVPDKAVVYETNNTAVVAESHLKVMLEEDYVALRKNMGDEAIGTDRLSDSKAKEISNVSAQVVKDVLIPEIEREVNEGKNFAQLRQIANSMILAAWYKKNLKESLLGQVYVDQAKLKGIDIENKAEVKEKIYNQYLEAFRAGVYDYIKEDYDPATQDWIPRRYFSGGAQMAYSKALTGTRNFTDLSSEAQDNVRAQRGTLYNETVSLLDVGRRTNNEIIAKVVKDITDRAKEARGANLAKTKGVIPHREDEPAGFFAVNKRIETAMTTDGGHMQMDMDYVRELIEDYWGDITINQELVKNGVNVTALLDLLRDSELTIVRVKDLMNGSPAIVMRSNGDYQIAHVGVDKKRIFVADGVTEHFKNTNPGFLRAFLTRELIALGKARELIDAGTNYNVAVIEAEAFAEKIEKVLVGEELDKVVQAQVDRFIDEDYYLKLKEEYVVWDYQSSLLRERQGKDIIGGKTYQEAAKWASRPNKALRSFGATTKASIDFLSSDQDLLPKINEILQNLDTSDADARERAYKEIRTLILATPVPDPIAYAIGNAYDELVKVTGQERVAVRSSGKAEDVQIRSPELKDVSLGANAGQHDSYLGVNGREDVIERWRMDVASLFTDRVLDYRDGIMVLMSFDAILNDKKLTSQIVEKLEESDNADDQQVAKALKTKDIKIISSLKLRDALIQNGFGQAVERVQRARQMYMDLDNIAMGVTIMPMAGVDISFVMFGHEMSVYWTAMNFQDIPEEEYKNKGRVVTITTTYGIGESIVQGVTTPDTYLVHIFENNGELKFNVIDKQLGTKTIQTIYTYEAREQLGLEDDQALQDYLTLLDFQGAPDELVGVKDSAPMESVREVLQRLIEPKVDQTDNVSLTDEERNYFDYGFDKLKLLAHLLKEIQQHDIKIGTMFTDVPQDMRDQFSASDSQVVKIAREFYDISDQYHRLVDSEGAVGRNLGELDTAVTVQRRPSNVDADVDSPHQIGISYTFILKKNAEKRREENIPMPGESLIYEGDVLVQGIPTRNALTGLTYKIDGSRDLGEQFAEIKEIVQGRKKIVDGKVVPVASGEIIPEEERQLIIRTRETTPDYVPILKLDGVQGVIADVGGATSHAAVVSRELQIATVVGIQGWMDKLEANIGPEKAAAIRGLLNRTGTQVTVDANADENNNLGITFAGTIEKSVREINIDLKRLPKRMYTKIAYIFGMPNPMLAMSKMAQYDGYYGVALMRGEFAYAEEGVNPRFGRAYDNMLVYDYLQTERERVRGRNNHWNFLSDASRRALTRFKTTLKLRKEKRERGVNIPLDPIEALLEKYDDDTQKFNRSLSKTSRKDIDVIRKHSDEIDKLNGRLTGYLSYDEFFEAVHGGAVARMAAANHQVKNTVIYRSIDFKKNEARELIGSIVFDPEPENATMVGERGARWLLQPENEVILREEIRMLLRQVERGYTNIGFMFPFVATPNEMDQLLNILYQEEIAMSKEFGRPIYLREVGQMFELPSNVRQAGDFMDVLQRHENGTKKWIKEEFGVEAKRSSFISFGTNDLTQLTMGADRDNPYMSYLFDEAHPFVIKSIKHVAIEARKRNMKCGLCGRAMASLSEKNDPQSVKAAEEIYMYLGATGGYVGTEYLATDSTTIRGSATTLKYGVVFRPASRDNTIADNLHTNLEEGAGASPVFKVDSLEDLDKVYLSEFALFGDGVVLEFYESGDLKNQLKDEELKAKISQIGTIIYSNDRLDRDIKRLSEALNIPFAKITHSQEMAFREKIKDGDTITIDFQRRKIYNREVDINVQVRTGRTELEVATKDVEVDETSFDEVIDSRDYYFQVDRHPFALLGRGDNFIVDGLKRHFTELTNGNKDQAILFTTLDLESDDLVKLEESEDFIEEKEVNPPLGFSGLDALVKDDKWRRVLELELLAIAELIDEGYNISVQFNSVKVPGALREAMKIAQDVGLDPAETKFGMNTAWPGNYLRPSEFFNKGLSFVTIDEKKLAQGYFAADLYDNKRVEEFYTYKKIAPHLAHPIRDIRAAAKRAKIEVRTVPMEPQVVTARDELLHGRVVSPHTVLTPAERRAVLAPLVRSNVNDPSETKVRTLLNYLDAERERGEDEEMIEVIEDTLMKVGDQLPTGTINRIQAERTDEKIQNRKKVEEIEALGKKGNSEEAIQTIHDYIEQTTSGTSVMRAAVKALKKIIGRIGKERYAEMRLEQAREAERFRVIFGVKETPLELMEFYSEILGVSASAKMEALQTTKSFKPRYHPYVMRMIRLKSKEHGHSDLDVDRFINILYHLALHFDLSEDEVLKNLKEDFDAMRAKIREVEGLNNLTDEDLKFAAHFLDWLKYIVGASTGNHGVALAHVAKVLGKEARVSVSHKVHSEKRADITELGGIFSDTKEDGTPVKDYDDGRVEAAVFYFKNFDSSIMVPHSSPTVTDGYGTVMLEIARQLEEAGLSDKQVVVFVPVGEGGLAVSIAALAYALGLKNVKVVGVGTENYNSLELSRIAGYPFNAEIKEEEGYLLEDGIAVPTVDDFSLFLTEIFGDGPDSNFRLVNVHRDEAGTSTNLGYRDLRPVTPEGAFGVAASAPLKYQELINGADHALIILTGQRVTPDMKKRYYKPNGGVLRAEVLELTKNNPKVHSRVDNLSDGEFSILRNLTDEEVTKEVHFYEAQLEKLVVRPGDSDKRKAETREKAKRYEDQLAERRSEVSRRLVSAEKDLEVHPRFKEIKENLFTNFSAVSADSLPEALKYVKLFLREGELTQAEEKTDRLIDMGLLRAGPDVKRQISAATDQQTYLIATNHRNADHDFIKLITNPETAEQFKQWKRKLKKQNIKKMEKHSSGVIATSVDSLNRHGIFELFKTDEGEYRSVSMSEILDHARKNPVDGKGTPNIGYINGVLREFVSLKWMTREGKTADEMVFTLTDRGEDLIELAPQYSSVVAVMEDFIKLLDYGTDTPRAPPAEITTALRSLAEMSSSNWSIPSQADPILADQVQHHLDGMLAMPLMVYLRDIGIFNRFDQDLSINLSELKVNESLLEFSEVAFEILDNAEFVTKDGNVVALKALGQAAFDGALNHGVTVSYYGLMTLMEELMFGDPSSIEWRNPDGTEKYVNRTLNVRGSEAAHIIYFNIIGKMFVAMLDDMVDSGEIPSVEQMQEKVAADGEKHLFTMSDTGSGTGGFLEMMDRLLMEESKLGQLIKRYPNLYGRLMIGIDYNPEPQALTKKRLDTADIPNVVFWGDITDQAQISKDLETNLRALGITDPENLKLDVDASTFLVHNRPFKPAVDQKAVERRREEGPLSTGAFALPDGSAVDNAELEQNLYEFFLGIHSKAKRSLMIELHTVPEDEAEGTLTVAYNLHHMASGQFTVEKDVVWAEAKRAGLEVRKKSDFKTVTITAYERTELQQDLSSETNVPAALTQSLNNLGLKQKVIPLVGSIIHDKSAGPQGLATVAVRNLVAFTDKSELRKELRDHIKALLNKNSDSIAGLYIDGQEEFVNSSGKYIIRVNSLESTTNIVTGTANGTSIDFYTKNLEFLGAVRIQWGSAVRAIITNGEKVQDYVLMGDGKLVEVEKPGDQADHRIQIPEGKIASLGGESNWRPQFMRDLEKDVLAAVGTKGRHADAATADLYKIITEGGIMTRWVTKAEALSISKFFKGVGGSALYLTPLGLKDLDPSDPADFLDLTLTKEDLTSTKQYYVIAGSNNVIDKVRDFANGIETAAADQTQLMEYYKDTVREKPTPVELPVITIDEDNSVVDYLDHEFILPSKLFVGEGERKELLTDDIIDVIQRFTGHYGIFTHDLIVTLPAQDSEQWSIIKFLREEAPEVFFEDQGVEKIHSLQWVLQNILEPSEPGSAMNASGDVAKKLDKIFNAVFKLAFRPFVHAIISEEDPEIVYGVGTDANDTEGHRIVVLLDPIDGSSMITGGAAFGSIVAFAVLKPGQSIEDGTFNPREQVVIGFDVKYGPSTILTLFNPSTYEGKPSISQFSLVQKSTGQPFSYTSTFDYEFEYPSLIATELANLEWDGLLPKVNVSNPERTTVRLSYGGSSTTASAAHTAFVEWVKDTYGYDSTYTGALINDESENSLAYLSGERRAGVLYTYPLQYKGGKASGKLRLLFEGLYFAAMRRAMGGALTDGLQPHLNIPFSGNKLSGIKVGYSSGSSWLTNLEMAFNIHLKQKGIDVNDDQATAEWDGFISEYQKRTRDLVGTLAVISINRKEQRTQDEIRRALLTWDSTDTGDNHIYNLIFNQTYVEVYDKLFAQSDADLAAEGVPVSDSTYKTGLIKERTELTRKLQTSEDYTRRATTGAVDDTLADEFAYQTELEMRLKQIDFELELLDTQNPKERDRLNRAIVAIAIEALILDVPETFRENQKYLILEQGENHIDDVTESNSVLRDLTDVPATIDRASQGNVGVAVGIAVTPARFRQINQANGFPKIHVAEAEGVQEFLLPVANGLEGTQYIAVMTDTKDSKRQTMNTFINGRDGRPGKGEAIQQVEVWAKGILDYVEATLLEEAQRDGTNIKPIVDRQGRMIRTGINDSKVLFVLVTTKSGQRVLYEMKEQPDPKTDLASEKELPYAASREDAQSLINIYLDLGWGHSTLEFVDFDAAGNHLKIYIPSGSVWLITKTEYDAHPRKYLHGKKVTGTSTDLSAEAVSLFEQELAGIQATLEDAGSLETSQKTTYEDRATRLELLIELENARRTAAAFSKLLDTPHPAMAATAERLENKNIEIAALEKKLEELGNRGVEPVIGTDLSAEAKTERDWFGVMDMEVSTPALRELSRIELEERRGELQASLKNLKNVQAVLLKNSQRDAYLASVERQHKEQNQLDIIERLLGYIDAGRVEAPKTPTRASLLKLKKKFEDEYDEAERLRDLRAGTRGWGDFIQWKEREMNAAVAGIERTEARLEKLKERNRTKRAKKDLSAETLESLLQRKEQVEGLLDDRRKSMKDLRDSFFHLSDQVTYKDDPRYKVYINSYERLKARLAEIDARIAQLTPAGADLPAGRQDLSAEAVSLFEQELAGIQTTLEDAGSLETSQKTTYEDRATRLELLIELENARRTAAAFSKLLDTPHPAMAATAERLENKNIEIAALEKKLEELGDKGIEPALDPIGTDLSSDYPDYQTEMEPDDALAFMQRHYADGWPSSIEFVDSYTLGGGYIRFFKILPDEGRVWRITDSGYYKHPNQFVEGRKHEKAGKDLSAESVLSMERELRALKEAVESPSSLESFQKRTYEARASRLDLMIRLAKAKQRLLTNAFQSVNPLESPEGKAEALNDMGETVSRLEQELSELGSRGIESVDLSSEKPVGGIDLNPQLLDMQIKRDGNGVALPLPQQPLHQINIEGFVPVIINVTPIQSLPLLLGMSDDELPEEPFKISFTSREPMDRIGRARELEVAAR